MRQLNKKQKKMLTGMVDQGKLGIDELTEEEYWEVYNVNQHECFDSNANRFMGDLYCERKYGNAH